MNKEFAGFILPWKDIVDIDDFLAEQTDKTVREIRARFERKKEECPHSREVLEFQLGIVLRKKELLQKDKSVIPYVCIEIGLLSSASADPSKKNYFKAAALLRDTLWESTKEKVGSERVSIKFSRNRKAS
jgi:hypothetical protein